MVADESSAVQASRVLFWHRKKVSIETALQVGYIMFHVHKSKKRRPTAPTADVGDRMQPLYVLKGLVDLRSRSDHGCPPHVEARESVLWLMLVSKSRVPLPR